MKRKLKRFLAFSLAIMMMGSLSSIAYAAGGTLASYMKNTYYGDYYTDYLLPYHQGNGEYIFPAYLPADDEQYRKALEFLEDYNNPSSTSTYLINFIPQSLEIYKFSSLPTLLAKNPNTFNKSTYMYYFTASTVECLTLSIIPNSMKNKFTYYPDKSKSCVLYNSAYPKDKISYLTHNPTGGSLNSVIPRTTDVKSVSFDIKGRYRSITLNYKYIDGSAAKTSSVYDYLPGDSYSITPSIVYGCYPYPSKFTGIMPDENLIFDVTCSQSSLSHRLTINYLYEDGSIAAERVYTMYEAGGTFNISSPKIDGFSPSVSVATGVMPSTDYTMDVIYSPKATENTLTVNYLYSEDHPAAESVTQALEPGAEYSIPSPEVEGYTPDIPLVTGTMPEDDLTVNVYYTRAFYELRIKYQYADGSQAKENVVFQYPLGFNYDIPSPEIAGYRPDKLTVAGEMPGRALEEVITYTAIPYTLTVNYQFADGSQAAQSHQEQLTIGSEYSVPSPEIEGYRPNQSMVTGIMPASDVISTVTYREDSGGSSGTGGTGAGDSGTTEGGGDHPGGGGSDNDPFIPILPPAPDYDPFVIPGLPSYSGYDPFIISGPSDFSGYDPFIVPKIPSFSGYDPFAMPDK